MTKIAVIVPTLNAGKRWLDWLQAFARQNITAEYRLVVDSSSDDDTLELAKAYGFERHVIAKADFNHGGTRQLAVDLLPEADILVFLTQDAILNNHDAIDNLVKCFADPLIGAAYGRQLPHLNAGSISAHARLFNYPDKSQIRSLSDKQIFGIKTVFISNSFAAYRRSALLEVGGFPIDTIMNEDTYVAGKMLVAGWKMAYCAEAQVFHSHDYTFNQELNRYFDIGVFHAHTTWLQNTFGGASGEGWRFVKSELGFLLRTAPWLIPSALIRTVLKWLGYKLGKTSLSGLPIAICRTLSLHKNYWFKYQKSSM